MEFNGSEVFKASVDRLETLNYQESQTDYKSTDYRPPDHRSPPSSPSHRSGLV
jgi:hypothetical protein